jgi:hypothetical protein
VTNFRFLSGRIRKRLWKNRDLGELARDVDTVISKVPWIELVQFDAPYTEPLYVGYDHEPAILWCGRIRNVETMETPLRTGGMVHFTWEGTRKRCRIDSVDGMTPTPGDTYRYTFLMVG